MSPRSILVLVVAVIAALGGFLLGQLQQGEPPPPAPVAQKVPAPVPAPAPQQAAAPAPAPAVPAPAAPPQAAREAAPPPAHPPAGHPQTASPAAPRPPGAGAPQPLRAGGAHPPVVDPSVKFAVGNSNVKAMLADKDAMWIGSSRGVIRYQPSSGEHRVYDNKSGLLSNGIFHLSKVGGELWVGTYGGGLSILDPATMRWRNYNIPEGLADAFVYDALRTKSGDVWLATWSGANRVKGGALDDVKSWETHTVASTNGGLPNDWVYGIAEGRDGEVWFATEGGLARFAGDKWQSWTHKDGLGAEYAAVKSEITFRNDPGQVSSHHAMQKKEQGLGDVDIAYNPNYVISLAVDDAGRVWAGTWGAGLSVFDGQSFRTYTLKDGLPSNHIFMLRRDPKGMLWIGTSHGLARFDGTSFVRFAAEDGLYSNNVFSMAFAENGEVWVGSFGGIAQFPKGLTK